jgi:hypothetical protein
MRSGRTASAIRRTLQQHCMGIENPLMTTTYIGLFEVRCAPKKTAIEADSED